MPFYTDLSSLYATPSSSYSAPYLSGPYSSHSSIIASNFTRPSASFGKSAPRSGFSRNYKPHLATISESQLASRPIPRINPPSLLLHTSPKYKIQRPISINTADIDVSVNKYRKFERVQKPALPLLKFDRNHSEPVMVKPSVEPAAPAEDAGDNFMPRIDPDTRSTIKRQRTVVRFHTDHKAEPNAKQNERAVLAMKPKWRENFDPSELTGSERKMPVKTPGAKLMEKFLIKDTIREEDEDKIRNEIEERKRLREEKLKLYGDDKLERKQRRSIKRKQSVKKTPSFHDICRTISSDKINEDLNPVHTIMEHRRQSKIISDAEILKEIRRNSAEILQEQVLLLDEMLRQQNEADTTLKTEEKTGKVGEETDDDKVNQDYGSSSRGSIKRKKKITKKKSNEKIILPPEDEEEIKTSLCRRPVHKKTRRSSTASSLDSVIEDSTYDKEKEQAYHDAIRDTSQGDVDKIEVKTKPLTKEVEQKQQHLKALVEQTQGEDNSKTRRRFAINYTVEESGEKRQNEDVNAKNAENSDASVLKRNLQNMLLDSSSDKSAKTKIETTGVVQNAKPLEIMTSNVLQKQPVAGRKGEILQEKILNAAALQKPQVKKEHNSSPLTSNREVNNNDINLKAAPVNRSEVNKSLTGMKRTDSTERDDSALSGAIAKDAAGKLSKKPVERDLAKVADDQDRKPNLLRKSKSVKDLEADKLHEDETTKKSTDDETELIHNTNLKRNKLEVASATAKNSAAIESKETRKAGAQEIADKNKPALASIKAPDVEDTVNQSKPQNAAENKHAFKIEAKTVPDKAANKRAIFTSKKKTEKTDEDGEFDFWSSIDPEENVVKTREMIKAEQEKLQMIKYEEEIKRLEEIEKQKKEDEKKKQLEAEEEQKRKLKLAEEERKRKQRLEEEEERKRQIIKADEEIRRRRALVEEQKKKHAEESEKQRQKLAEEEQKRKQKIAEEEEKQKQKEREEEEKRKQKEKMEEEKRKRKLAEEEEQKRNQKLAEDEEKRKRKLAEEEEQKRKQKLAEDEEKRKLKLAEEEEQRRKQKLAEDEEKRKRKLAEEEEQKRKQKLAEDEEKRKKKLKEEEDKKKQKLAEEEKLKHKLKEDEKIKQKLAEEERKQKEKEKRQKEAERKQKEEERKQKEEEKKKQKLAQEEEKRKLKEKEQEEKRAKALLLQEEKMKRKRLKEELQNQTSKLVEAAIEGRRRKEAEEEEENRKQKLAEEEEQMRKDAEIEAERVRVEENKRMVSKRSIVTKYNTIADPDLEVFQVPEEPEPEPEPEPSSGGFVPLQSNRISQFMIPFQKPEHFDECPIVIMATPKDIRKRHYPRPRVSKSAATAPPPPPPPPVQEEEDDDEDEDESDEDSSSEEDEATESGSSGEEYTVERSGAEIGKSTSSTDSGFDSSAPGSPANRRHNGIMIIRLLQLNNDCLYFC